MTSRSTLILIAPPEVPPTAPAPETFRERALRCPPIEEAVSQKVRRLFRVPEIIKGLLWLNRLLEELPTEIAETGTSTVATPLQTSSRSVDQKQICKVLFLLLLLQVAIKVTFWVRIR